MILTDREKRVLLSLVSNIRSQQNGDNEQGAILNAPESLLTKLEDLAK
jgi:hypothetical protein